MFAILALTAVAVAGLLLVGALAARMVRQLRVLDAQLVRARDRTLRHRPVDRGPAGPGREGRSIDGASSAPKRG